MKAFKNKKLNAALIAGTIAASVALGGAVAVIGATKSEPVLNAYALESNYSINNDVTGTTYYCAPGATGSGASASDPAEFSKLVHENTKPKPGDTYILAPGTYKYSTRIRIQASGAYNGYITVKKADPTQKVVFDFSEMFFDGNNRGVQIDGDFWHWDGIDVCGAGDNGLYIGGSYNVVENCEFYNNRDSGLQLGRSDGSYASITQWPSYNLVKNCTSHNNYDNETYGENADGFAAKLTIGYGNIFDGCIAYRNSDDGWDLYAKTDSGNIGAVIIYNCVAFENGYLEDTQEVCNARFPSFNKLFSEKTTNTFLTRDGDGNGFKLGGSVMEGDVYLYNCQSFHNRMHGVTDNSNPGVLSIKNVTAYNNSIGVDEDPESPTFGKIVLNGATGLSNSDGCCNINMARQEYSYNLFSGVVSMTNGNLTKHQGDEYRGSAEYSIFAGKGTKANKVEECVDVSNNEKDTHYGVTGLQVPALDPAIFKQLPFTWTGSEGSFAYTYNIDGLHNTTVHSQYRNADGSINMGDMLAIDNYETIFGDTNKTGAQLNKASWNDYTHYSYFNASNADSAEDAAVKSCAATLDLNTNLNATFQDFDLVVLMEDTSISWASSDTSVIEVKTRAATSPSGTHDSRAIVYRSATEDKKVTLTATITHAKKPETSITKTFEITVKKDVPTIGDAIFENVEDGVLIGDKFDKFTEPAMIIENAADYNGKLLDSSLYEVSTKVMYAQTKEDVQIEIHHFTPSVAGVYTIYKEVKLKGGDQSKTYNYNIYVASTTAKVDFYGKPTVTVNKDGYSISGEVNNPTGKLYAMSSKEALTNLTPEQIMAQGEGYDFRSDVINLQFKNDNSEAYHIYYAMFNMHGDATTEVKSIDVKTMEIPDIATFKSVLIENDTSTIYVLTNDLDFGGEGGEGQSWPADVTSKAKSFRGLLNGKGHTIKNFYLDYNDDKATDSYASIFYKLEGGTIENLKFENIFIKSPKNKVGIIATTYGGFIYNVAMNNVLVQGAVRVGGLVGQAMTGELHLDQVSLVNPARYEQATDVTADNFLLDTYYTLEGEEYVKQTEYSADATYYIRSFDIYGERCAAIIGFIQASQAVESTKTYISNVYADTVLGAAINKYVGSIIGSADDQNAKDYLEITNAYSRCIIYAHTYAGGILGSHNKGVGEIKLSNCIFAGRLFYSANKGEYLSAAVKNCSGIVGRFFEAARATVTNCYARFEDYNSNFDVDSDSISLGAVNTESFWKDTLGFSEDKWSYQPEGGRLKEPWTMLKFLGEWA